MRERFYYDSTGGSSDWKQKKDLLKTPHFIKTIVNPITGVKTVLDKDLQALSVTKTDTFPNGTSRECFERASYKSYEITRKRGNIGRGLELIQDQEEEERTKYPLRMSFQGPDDDTFFQVAYNSNGHWGHATIHVQAAQGKDENEVASMDGKTALDEFVGIFHDRGSHAFVGGQFMEEEKMTKSRELASFLVSSFGLIRVYQALNKLGLNNQEIHALTHQIYIHTVDKLDTPFSEVLIARADKILMHALSVAGTQASGRGDMALFLTLETFRRMPELISSEQKNVRSFYGYGSSEFVSKASDKTVKDLLEYYYRTIRKSSDFKVRVYPDSETSNLMFFSVKEDMSDWIDIDESPTENMLFGQLGRVGEPFVYEGYAATLAQSGKSYRLTTRPARAFQGKETAVNFSPTVNMEDLKQIIATEKTSGWEEALRYTPRLISNPYS